MPEWRSPPKPTAFVLFGATGDLAKRMVLPAFYRLWQEGLLPAKWKLIGNGRGDVDHLDFRKLRARRAHRVRRQAATDRTWSQFAEHVYFAGGGFDTDDPGSLLDVLSARAEQLGRERAARPLPRRPAGRVRRTHQGARRSTAWPRARASSTRSRSARPARSSARSTESCTRCSTSSRSTASTTSSARRRPRTCTCCASPTACSTRCGTASTSARCRSTSPRGSASPTARTFYDATGAVLDMLVTHLFQVAAEVAMEPPASLAADRPAGRARGGHRQRSARSTRPRSCSASSTATATSTASRRDSSTDTFVAARLWIDNERWSGVPFLLRTGKRLAQSHQRVSLILREPDGHARRTCRSTATCSASSSAATARSTSSLVAKRPGAELEPRRRRGDDPARPARRRRPAAALRAADPRRRCSATARCSPARTGWPRCGRSPRRCSTNRPAPSARTRQGSWGPKCGGRGSPARTAGCSAAVRVWETSPACCAGSPPASRTAPPSSRSLDGLPAGVEVTTADVARDLARRRLGYGRGARMKFEQDEVELTGGVRHGADDGRPGRGPRRQHRVAEVDDRDVGRPGRRGRAGRAGPQRAADPAASRPRRPRRHAEVRRRRRPAGPRAGQRPRDRGPGRARRGREGLPAAGARRRGRSATSSASARCSARPGVRARARRRRHRRRVRGALLRPRRRARR